MAAIAGIPGGDAFGFDGSVVERPWSIMMRAGASEYGFTTPSTLAPQVNAVAGTRMFSVTWAAGDVLWAAGVGLELPSAGRIDLPITAPSSGTRYTMLVARFTFGGNDVTIEQVHGGATAALPTRNVTYPVYEVPIALVRATSSSAQLAELRDLRLIGGAHGVAAYDKLVQTINGLKVGTRITIGRTPWTYSLVGSSTQWTVPSGTIIGDYAGSFAPLATPGDSSTERRVWGANNELIASITIPDPGQPYKVAAHFEGFYGTEFDTATGRWDAVFSVDGTIIGTKRYGGSWRSWRDSMVLQSPQLFTGAHTVQLRAIQAGTPGYGSIGTFDRSFRAVVTAV